MKIKIIIPIFTLLFFLFPKAFMSNYNFSQDTTVNNESNFLNTLSSLGSEDAIVIDQNKTVTWDLSEENSSNPQLTAPITVFGTLIIEGCINLSKLTIALGGQLTIKPSGKLKTLTNSYIAIQEGGIFAIESGGTLENNGMIAAESGAVVGETTISNTTEFPLDAPYSDIVPLIKNEQNIGENEAFTAAQVGNGFAIDIESTVIFKEDVTLNGNGFTPSGSTLQLGEDIEGERTSVGLTIATNGALTNNGSLDIDNSSLSIYGALTLDGTLYRNDLTIATAAIGSSINGSQVTNETSFPLNVFILPLLINDNTVGENGTFTAAQLRTGFIIDMDAQVIFNDNVTLESGRGVVIGTLTVAAGKTLTATYTTNAHFTIGDNGIVKIPPSSNLNWIGSNSMSIGMLAVAKDSIINNTSIDNTTSLSELITTVKIIPLLSNGNTIGTGGTFTPTQAGEGFILLESAAASIDRAVSLNPRGNRKVILENGSTLTLDANTLDEYTITGNGNLNYRSITQSSAAFFNKTTAMTSNLVSTIMSNGFSATGLDTVIDIRGYSVTKIEGPITVQSGAGLALDVDQAALIFQKKLTITQGSYISISATEENKTLKLIPGGIKNDGVLALDPALLPAGLDFKLLTNEALGIRGNGIIVPLVKNGISIDQANPTFPHQWDNGFVVDTGAQVTINTNLSISNKKAQVIIGNSAQVVIPEGIVFTSIEKITNNGLIASNGSLELSEKAISLQGAGTIALSLNAEINKAMITKGSYCYAKKLFGSAFKGNVVPLLVDGNTIDTDISITDTKNGFVIAPNAIASLSKPIKIGPQGKIIIMEKGVLDIFEQGSIKNYGIIQNNGVINGVIKNY